MGTLDALIYGLRDVFDAAGTPMPRRSRIKFDAVVTDDPMNDRIVVGGGLANEVYLEEIVFSAGTFSTGSNTYGRSGSRAVDMGRYPATIGALARQVVFVCSLENALHSATYSARAHLLDVTHANVEVAGTALDNSAAADKGVAAEYASAALTVGSSSGNVRSDVVTHYAVEFSGTGIVDPMTERAILSGARLEIRYV